MERAENIFKAADAEGVRKATEAKAAGRVTRQDHARHQVSVRANIPHGDISLPPESGCYLSSRHQQGRPDSFDSRVLFSELGARNGN